MKNMALLRRHVKQHGITCPGGKVIAKSSELAEPQARP